LELSANPFIALCGPPEYAEVRLNLSQAVQAIGTVVSPLLAKKVLFTANAESLIDVQWTYLGIAFFNIMLAIVYFYIPLPEATDEELEIASARMPIPRDATINIGRKPVKVLWIGLGLAVFSQFCYVGGQESTSTSFAEYLHHVSPSINSDSHQAIGHTAFATSRFLAAAIDIRGMGRHTKDASVLLTAAIGGGAVIPPIMFAALKIHNAQYAFCVIIAAYAAGMLYPIWLNAIPAIRQLSDPIRDEHTRRESEAEEKRKASLGGSKPKRFSRIKNRFSWNKDDQLPHIEHRERRSWPEGLAPRTTPNGSTGIEPTEPVMPVLHTYSNTSTSESSHRR
jgi:fucose permease